MAGGGVTLMTLTHVPNTEMIIGPCFADEWDIAIASGTYPTNGYTLDPANLGQLNRFKVITDAQFSAKGVGALGILWQYDLTNKSMRGYQQGAGAGALTELTGTVGGATVIVRVRLFGN